MPALESVPYAHAKVKPEAARGEITKLLRKFGCQSVGIMDDYEKGSVILAFKHRGRQVQMEASAKGWAAMFLARQPTKGRGRRNAVELQRRALAQGAIAVNAILRDWIKGQITAVECGLVDFDSIFFAYMVLPDGRRVTDLVKPHLQIEGPAPCQSS